MPAHPWQWAVLAEKFPPSLVTNMPASELEPQHTPNATGLDASAEGYLAAGSIPSGAARVARSYTATAPDASSASYTWHYNRLWRALGAKLIFGAPEYTANYFPQELGELDCNDDTGSIITFLPLGKQSIVVFKATGAYIIDNANDPQANFQRSDFIEEAFISTAGHAIDLDGFVYFTNTKGCFAISPDGAVVEISFPIRGQIVAGATLTCDYRHKYLIVGSSFVFDANNKRWLKYDSSNFIYVARTMRLPQTTRSAGGEPFAVDSVAIEYDRTDASDATVLLSYQVDSLGSRAAEVSVPYAAGTHQRAECEVNADTGRAFVLTITSLPSTVRIRRILVRYAPLTMGSGGSD